MLNVSRIPVQVPTGAAPSGGERGGVGGFSYLLKNNCLFLKEMLSLLLKKKKKSPKHSAGHESLQNVEVIKMQL